jgi:hypothetical protein
MIFILYNLKVVESQSRVHEQHMRCTNCVISEAENIDLEYQIRCMGHWNEQLQGQLALQDETINTLEEVKFI